MHLFTQTGQFYCDTGNDISPDEYKGSCALFAFELTPQMNSSEDGFKLLKHGNIWIEIHFADATTRTLIWNNQVLCEHYCISMYLYNDCCLFECVTLSNPLFLAVMKNNLSNNSKFLKKRINKVDYLCLMNCIFIHFNCVQFFVFINKFKILNSKCRCLGEKQCSISFSREAILLKRRRSFAILIHIPFLASRDDSR